MSPKTSDSAIRGFPDLTMTAGPADISADTLSALGRRVLYHYDPAFLRLYAETTEKMKKVLFTENDVILMHGEALLGLEAAAFNCIKPGDKCLNLVSGHYGKGYEGFISASGGEVGEIAVGYDDAVDPALVRKALDENDDIKVLSVVHSETPSSTMNPVWEICRMAKDRGILTIVDSVSGVGGMEMRVDDWGIDVCVVGPQKCLSAPPGLAILSVSADAWNSMRRKNPPRGTYLSLLDWKELWLDGGVFPCTPSVSLVYALSDALDQILAEGMEEAWRRHAECARVCRAGLRGMGLELWARSETVAANSSTAFKIPGGIRQKEFRAYLRRRYGVMISAGLANMADKILRVGHMGHTAKPLWVLSALVAVGKAFQDFGVGLKVGAGIDAALGEIAKGS
jgi:pyridoxamine---pyruvate transaminase